MLQPVTSEHDWLTALSGAPGWQPPRKRTVVLTPHPDDETLGAGGLIAAQCRAGVETIVVAVTDGEAAYPDRPRLAELRRAEQEKALAALGVTANNIIRFKLPDSGVTQCEEELLILVRHLIDNNTLLVAPWPGDPHPDHEITGRIAQLVSDQRGAELLGYFFWSWHHLTPETLKRLSVVRFGLDSELSARRAAALCCYRSQMEHESGQPILPEILLAPARRPFETYTCHV